MGLTQTAMTDISLDPTTLSGFLLNLFGQFLVTVYGVLIAFILERRREKKREAAESEKKEQEFLNNVFLEVHDLKARIKTYIEQMPKNATTNAMVIRLRFINQVGVKHWGSLGQEEVEAFYETVNEIESYNIFFGGKFLSKKRQAKVLEDIQESLDDLANILD